MAFGVTPVDTSTSPIPMSSAVPDGTNTPLAVEGGPSKVTGGNTLVPVATYHYDGYDVTQGLIADTAVVGDVSGTVGAKLRGISKIWNDIWDSTNHWFRVSVQNANANGQVAMVASAPVVIASDQSAVATKAAAAAFATGAIVDLPVKGTAIMTGATPVTIATDDTQITAIKNSVAAIPAKGTAVMTGSTPMTVATNDTVFAELLLDTDNLATILTALQGVLQIKRTTVAVYSLASTTSTGATQNSGDLTVGPYTQISIDINSTAQTGTAPTLQFFYERKAADNIYYVLWQTAVLSAAANTISTSIGEGMAYNQSLGVTGRLRWVVGGSATPTYTFSASIQGK